MDTPSILVLGHCAETVRGCTQISHAKQHFQQLGAPVIVNIRCSTQPGSATVDLPGTSSLVLHGQHSA
jgi:hypothetical protein